MKKNKVGDLKGKTKVGNNPPVNLDDSEENPRDSQDKQKDLETREKVKKSVILSQLDKKGLKGKCSKKIVVQPPRTIRGQVEEICEELDRRDTEIAAKEGLSHAQWGKKQIKKGRSVNMAKFGRLVQIEDSPIVERPNSLIVELKTTKDDVMAGTTFEPEPMDDEMMAGIVDVPEPQKDDEETVVKVFKLEPNKRRLIKKTEKKMNDAEKKKKRTSELAKLVEAGSEGEQQWEQPIPSSFDDSLELTRIIESVIEDIESKHGSELFNATT